VAQEVSAVGDPLSPHFEGQAPPVEGRNGLDCGKAPEPIGGHGRTALGNTRPGGC